MLLEDQYIENQVFIIYFKYMKKEKKCNFNKLIYIFT